MKKNSSRKIIVKSYGKSKNRNPKFRVFRVFSTFSKILTSKSQIFGIFIFDQKIQQQKIARKFFYLLPTFLFSQKPFNFVYNLVRCLVCRFRTFLQGFEQCLKSNANLEQAGTTVLQVCTVILGVL